MQLAFFEFAPLPWSLKVLKTLYYFEIFIGLVLVYLSLTQAPHFQTPSTSEQYMNGALSGLVEILPSSYPKSHVEDNFGNSEQFAYATGENDGRIIHLIVFLILGGIISLHGINSADIRWFLPGCTVILAGCVLGGLFGKSLILLFVFFRILNRRNVMEYFNKGAQSRVENLLVPEPPEPQIVISPPVITTRPFGRRK